MNHRKAISFVAGLLALSLLAGVAYAQTPAPTPTPTPRLDTHALALGFATWEFWVVLAATLIAGAAGGVVYELLILQGSIERPHKVSAAEEQTYSYAIGPYLSDLGIWARVIIGALAAVGAMLVFAPKSTTELLAVAIIAGSAGTAVFRSLQDRVLSALSDQRAAATAEAAAQQKDKVEEAQKALDALLAKLSAGGAGAGAPPGAAGAPPAGVPVDPEELRQVDRLLSEARGTFIPPAR